MKEFCTCSNCSDSELGAKVNAGWEIQFMQFTPDGKLNVVFIRDVPPAAAPVPKPVDKPLPRVIVPRPIANRKLPGHVCIQGLGDIPITPVQKEAAPQKASDPVMNEALRVGRETFDRVRSEGEAKIKAAANVFRPNINQGVQP